MIGINKPSASELTITAYKTVKRKSSDLVSPDQNTFTALVNPDSFKRTFSAVYQKSRGINTSSQSQRYGQSNPQQLHLTLILDDTGATNTGLDIGPLSSGGSVEKQVDDFLSLCSNYNGDIHEPNYLIVNWGKLNFQCKLLSVDIQFSLFSKEGKPFRAELNTIFIEDISNEERAKLENKNSPDVTHSHLFVAGDTLPLICFTVYGSSAYVLNLADFNQIDHFRDIEPGTELRLPPLEQLKNYGPKI